MINVSSHIPGRIRIKANDIRFYHGIGESIQHTIIAIQGVKDVRVNEYACSIIIYYDEQVLDNKTLKSRVEALNFSECETSEIEHQYTRGDVALNIIGTLSALLLPKHLGALTTAILISPAILFGLQEIKLKKLSVEVLDAVALSLSFWRGDYKTAMMTQSFISFGEYMEDQTNRKSDRLLADLMSPQETEVWLISDSGEKLKVASNMLEVGNLIELMPGDAIPADGHVEQGTALINQASLTGESVPVRRELDAYVYSGTSIHDGSIKVRIDKVGSEATTAKIAKLIYDSLSQKSETQQVTQEMADRRVKITLAIGAAVFALTQDFNRLASVFLVDYSCALKLSTPVTFKSIMYKAAQNGIVLKGGCTIEKLVDIDTCVFDKTGTLTHGDMEVTDVISFCNDNTPKDLLAVSASVEEHSNHPLSQAIVQAAKKNELPHIEHGEVEYVIAHGLKSTLDDRFLVMGSRHLLEEHELIDFSEHEHQILELEQLGRHLIYIACEGVLIGMIGLRDHLRDDVFKTLAELRQCGIEQLVMISGDRRYKAQMLGDELKLDKIYAEASPESKSSIIEELKDQGRNVMFVGDGVNDAPALTKADVGIAMCIGTELARQVADVVLLKDELYAIVEARKMSEEAMSLINSNIKIAEYVNSGIMLGAAMGWLNPSLSAILHNGTTLGVLMRSMAGRH